MSWVLVLVSNTNYIDKALLTIKSALTIGEWKDSIVLITDNETINNSIIDEIRNLGVNILIAPKLCFENVNKLWDKNCNHSYYDYVTSRRFQYMKFYTMDQYFKKWDYVFYIDSGAKILKSLNRFKESCKPKNCFYAHSDSYPTFEWKLKIQFCLDLNEDISSQLLKKYNLESDYFQTTLFIYDTRILTEDYVSKLINLMNLYPISGRNDQGIFNLLVLCEKKLWKPIPTKDEQGFLYDFMVRPGYTIEDYTIIKY